MVAFGTAMDAESGWGGTIQKGRARCCIGLITRGGI